MFKEYAVSDLVIQLTFERQVLLIDLRLGFSFHLCFEKSIPVFEIP